MNARFVRRFVPALLTIALAASAAHAQGGTAGGGGQMNLGMAYLSDIEAYLITAASNGDSRQNQLHAPKVTIFNGVTLPNGGIGQFYDEGYMLNVNVVVPVGDGTITPRGAYRQWGLNTGFTFTQWNANNSASLNQIGGKNFDIGSGQSYCAEIGPQLWWVRPTNDGRAWFVGVGVNGVLGGMNVNLPVGKFSAAQDQVIINGAPRSSAFIGGFCVRAQTGYIFDNGWKVVLEGGYQGLGSSVITGRDQYSDGFFIGGSVHVPLGTPTLSRIPLLSRLFRNTGVGREPSSIMIMPTPRIIMPLADN